MLYVFLGGGGGRIHLESGSCRDNLDMPSLLLMTHNQPIGQRPVCLPSPSNFHTTNWMHETEGGLVNRWWTRLNIFMFAEKLFSSKDIALVGRPVDIHKNKKHIC